MAELVAAVRDIESEASALGVPLVVVLFPDRILADAELRAQFPPDVAESDAPLRVHDAVVEALAGIPLIDTLPLLERCRARTARTTRTCPTPGNVAAGEYVAARLRELLPQLGCRMPRRPRE